MLNQIDKMRESRFWRALFAALIAVSLSIPSIAWADEETSEWQITASGSGSVEVTDVNGETVTIPSGETKTFNGEVGTYLTIHGTIDEGTEVLKTTQRVTFDGLEGVNQLAATDKVLHGNEFTWWLTFDGTNKHATYYLGSDVDTGIVGYKLDEEGNVAQQNTLSAQSEISTQSLSDPKVGDVYTGYGTVTNTEVVSSGGAVGHFDVVFSSGPLAGQGSYRAYCADHGAAALERGAQVWYSFTVTSLDYERGRVYGNLYGEGLGEYTPRDNYQTITTTSWFAHNFDGWVKVQKQSANPDITDNNDCYSLAGAIYSVFKTEDDARAGVNAVSTAKTNDKGFAESGWIKPGDYFVKETTPAQGYDLDDEIYPVTVTAGHGEFINKDNGSTVEDMPLSDPAAVMLGKYDGDHFYRADGEGNVAQGNAPSLAGAIFKVQFYPEHFSTVKEAQESGVEPRTWYVSTDKDGYCDLSEEYLAEGHESSPFYTNNSGTPTLPLGTLTFQEIEAPEGYNLEKIVDANGEEVEEGIFIQQVTEDGVNTTIAYDMPLIPNTIDKGGIEIEKRDLETNGLTGQGNASIDGTTFEIYNESEKAVTVRGIDYQPGDAIECLTKDLVIKDGKCSTDDQTLPYGSYSIREVSPGQGYNLTDGEPRYFTISENHQMIHFSDTTENAEGGAFKNAVKRGDLSFTKVRTMDNKRLAGIPFKITSQTTGESHIVVTDENGEVNTAASFNEHTQNTNGNDDGNYDASNGVWFGSTEPRNDMGALPYDTYTLEELSCDKNQGMVLATFDFTISRDAYNLDMGDVLNSVAEKPYIGTHATDATDGDKLIIADTEAVINDHVSYSALAANETYTLTASLVDKTTGEQIPGASAQVTFETKSDRGSVEVQIPVNLVDYAGKDVVVYEVLTQGGVVVAEHQEIDDSEQTVHVVTPVIGTTATDEADGDHKIINDAEATIIDTIRYENLVPGKEYTATGTLMLKTIDEDGDVEATELLDKDGNPITVTTQFTPKSASGSVDVVFVFDASMLDSGTQIVVYEKVLRGDVVIATHEDPTDSNQTVETIVPEIGTTAVDGVDGDKNVVSDKGMRVVDTIAYKNLVVGKEYTATGKLMEKVIDENGNVTERELTDDHGNVIEATATFTPTTPNGTVDVEFVFDGYTLEKGTQIVAFEEVFAQGKSVAVHADINDDNQMVEVVNPKIGTTAYDAFDLDQNVIADKDAKIIDTVKYESLIPGKKYTVAGIVMDKTTGMPLLSGEGASEITDGDLMTFVHGLATLLGISDEEFAAMTATGSAGATSEFIDFVGEFAEAFGTENPLAGFTDRITSDMNVSVDALEEYFAENAQIVNCLTFAQKSFTPNTADGSVDMTFPVNTEGMDGKELVVYELMFANDVIAASHVDITDKGQTVEVVPSSIGTTATDKTDGDHYLLPSTEAVVVDTVDYENLVPGKEYTLKGWLMDKASGKQLVIDDKPVASEIKFTPNNTSGKVDIEFTFDASKLSDGAELVAFEELYKDNVLVAEHKDIDDEGQTVTIGEPPATPEDGDYAKTGENLIGWIILAIALVGGATVLTVYGVRKRNAQKSEAPAEDTQSTPNE